MTLDEIITLFEEMEAGKQEQKIGFHLHSGIGQILNQSWRAGPQYSRSFSGFLKALKDAPKPE